MALATLLDWFRGLSSTGRLMCGVGDYEAYCRHLAEHHPERTPLSYEEFFKERMAAKYRKGASRCC